MIPYVTLWKRQIYGDRKKISDDGEKRHTTVIEYQ